MKIIVRGLVPGTVFGRPPSLLYHYTSQEGLLGITSSKCAWATHSAFLNDSRELKYAMALALDVAQDLKKLVRGIYRRFLTSVAKLLNSLDDQPVFVFSLSEEGDQLSQWRGYASAGRGYSIGFHVRSMRDILKAQDFFLAPCIYDRVDQKRELRKLFRSCFRTIDAAEGWQPLEMARRNFSLHFMPLAARLKDPTFHEEKEWRLISSVRRARTMQFRPGPSSLVPYFALKLAAPNAALPVRRLIAGPTPDPHRSHWALKCLLESASLSFTEITISSIPFRSW